MGLKELFRKKLKEVRKSVKATSASRKAPKKAVKRIVSRKAPKKAAPKATKKLVLKKAIKPGVVSTASRSECPECGSVNVVISKMTGNTICQDCGAIFAGLIPEVEQKFEEVKNQH